MAINNFDVEDFLDKYWQKKPLLIRDAFPDFDNPLTPNEIAGLACEESVESRIIKSDNGHWQLSHGPFEASQFSDLSEKNWTLLVQSLDHWVPEIALLLNKFRFIPNWRIDDIMASFAVPGGSVGPHFDNYDVFLLQGSGTRQWRVGNTFNSNSPTLSHPDLKLLADFNTVHEWELHPGDMLYLPPQIGHWGISTSNDCITYSVGYRAPSHAELLSNFCDDVIAKLNEERRFSDPNLHVNESPGMISASAIKQVKSILSGYLEDEEKMSEWFGRYMTEPKHQHEDYFQTDELLDEETSDTSTPSSLKYLLEAGTSLYRNSCSRFAYNDSDKQFYLFVDGLSFSCVSDQSIRLSKIIANHGAIDSFEIIPLLDDTECFTLFTELLNLGSVIFDDGNSN